MLFAGAAHLRRSGEARRSDEALDVLLAAAAHLRRSGKAVDVLLAEATQLSRSGGMVSGECWCVHRQRTPYGGRRYRLGG
ncbi:MAG TPA: hypothetical protein VGD51_08105 [Nocardioidaceae bacterium]